jgi:hypothetical protein
MGQDRRYDLGSDGAGGDRCIKGQSLGFAMSLESGGGWRSPVNPCGGSTGGFPEERQVLEELFEPSLADGQLESVPDHGVPFCSPDPG